MGQQAEQAAIVEIRSAATGLLKDWDAVTAGLSMAGRSGAVEGNVNHIKMIKRQMFGRANPDLLRRRILRNDWTSTIGNHQDRARATST